MYRHPAQRAVLFAALLAPLLLGGCASSAPRNPDDLCAVFSEKRDWHTEARSAAKRWNGPLHVPMAIMFQESGFRAKARPPRRYFLGFIPLGRPSSAFGYSQAQSPAWKQYRQESGNGWAERDDFEDAIDFMQWYMDKSKRLNGVAKTDAYRQYLNYHEGWGGYRRGSYRGKATLESAARRVEARAKRYAEQYAGCRKRLEGGWLRRLLSGKAHAAPGEHNGPQRTAASYSKKGGNATLSLNSAKSPGQATNI